MSSGTSGSGSNSNSNSKSRTIPLEVQLSQVRLQEVRAGKFQPTSDIGKGIVVDPPISPSELDTLISKYLESIKSEK